MKNFSLLLAVVLFVVFVNCGTNQANEDKAFKEYEKRSLEYQNEMKENNRLVDSTVILVSKIEKKAGCNKKHIRCFFIAKTNNKDSLLSAARIITDDVSIQSPKDPDCRHRMTVAIWFFESEKKEKINQWRMMASCVNGNPATSQWGEYYEP